MAEVSVQAYVFGMLAGLLAGLLAWLVPFGLRQSFRVRGLTTALDRERFEHAVSRKARERLEREVGRLKASVGIAEERGRQRALLERQATGRRRLMPRADDGFDPNMDDEFFAEFDCLPPDEDKA